MKKEIEEIVSRETMEKFLIYYDLLVQWNRRTSLVQQETLGDFWGRHILDSLQLQNYVQDKKTSVIDIGSGAGFPGMVLAMAGYENITLCESNVRKTVFLDEVSRVSKTPVRVFNERIENLQHHSFDIVVSRACASLEKLLDLSRHIVSRETFQFCLFLKGKKLNDEIQDAQRLWSFSYEIYTSQSSEEGRIIKIWDILEKTDNIER